MNTKKDLKESYKQMKLPSGVFQIRNKSNNRILVDYSTNMNSKWNRHKTELRFGSHRNKALQVDWNLTTESNFEFSVLSELKVEDDKTVNIPKELKTLESMVIEEMDIPKELFY